MQQTPVKPCMQPFTGDLHAASHSSEMAGIHRPHPTRALLSFSLVWQCVLANASQRFLMRPCSKMQSLFFFLTPALIPLSPSIGDGA